CDDRTARAGQRRDDPELHRREGAGAAKVVLAEARPHRTNRFDHAHSTEMSLALIGTFHFSISLATKRARYSGDLRSGATVWTPISRKRSRKADVSSAATALSCSLSTIAAGAFFGRKSAYQMPASKPARPCSWAVAICGSCGRRSLART